MQKYKLLSFRFLSASLEKQERLLTWEQNYTHLLSKCIVWNACNHQQQYKKSG